MKKIDIVFFSIILYPVFPIILFLSGWWGSLILGLNNYIQICALTGLILGFLIDYFFVSKKIIFNSFKFDLLWAILILSFYEAGLFGFFMGVPVFHPFLGIMLGFYVARKSLFFNWTKSKFDKELRKVNITGLTLMFLICVASAFFALSDPYTSGNLEGMLALPFAVTQDMIIILIILGGSCLLIGQYYLTWATAAFARKLK